MIRKSCKTALILLALAASALHAQSYFQYMGLEQTPKHSGRSLALGGTVQALENHPLAGLHNPAMLYQPADALGLYANMNMAAFTERRSFPVQDSFGDFIAENDYVSSRFQKWEGDLALYYSQKGFSASAGWYTFENLNYDYQEEIRSDLGSGAYYRDPLAGFHKVHFGGLLHGLNIALAHDIGERFAVGYAYSRYFGTNIEEGFGVIPILPNDRKLASRDTTYFPAALTNAGGSSINLGIRADVTKRLQLALSMEMQGDYTARGAQITAGMDSSLLLPAYTAQSDSSYELLIQRPSVYSLSLRYIPANELKTTLYAQFDLTDWRRYAVGYFDSADSLVAYFTPDYKVAWTLRAGVEHVFFTGMPFRFGFVYEKNPLGNQLNRSSIHVGSGMVRENLRVDVGLALYQNLYYYDDLFPVTGEVRETRDKVKESSLRANVSISYLF